MIAHPADAGDLRYPAPPEAADPPHLPLAPASAWEPDDSRARPSHRGPGRPGDAGPAPRDARRESTSCSAAGRQAVRGRALQAQHHHLRGRRGAKKAICAVAASLLTAACRMLKGGTACRELGPEHFDRRAKESQA